MALSRWISKKLKYGFGESAREKYRADKAIKRQEKFESERWDKDAENVHRRYKDYDEYLEHQASKLGKIRKRLEVKDVDRFDGFKERFATCKSLDETKTVLCLGARLGTEVKALLELGHFAVGIDLNPGGDNPYVLPGDFHNIVFPAGSVDVVYTNVLDHVFDLKKVVGEVHRLLKPGGKFVTDVVPGFEEGFTPGEFESHHWPTIDFLKDKIVDAAALSFEGRRDLGDAGENLWIQLEFQKSEKQTNPGNEMSASN